MLKIPVSIWIHVFKNYCVINISKKLIHLKNFFSSKLLDGWTPLIWAANNSHDSVVKLLLDHGADATAKTANRRTVFDFMTPEQNPKIVEIFNHNPQRDSWSSTGSIGR